MSDSITPIPEFTEIVQTFEFKTKAKCNDCQSSNIALTTELEGIDREATKWAY